MTSQGPFLPHISLVLCWSWDLQHDSWIWPGKCFSRFNFSPAASMAARACIFFHVSPSRTCPAPAQAQLSLCLWEVSGDAEQKALGTEAPSEGGCRRGQLSPVWGTGTGQNPLGFSAGGNVLSQVTGLYPPGRQRKTDLPLLTASQSHVRSGHIWTGPYFP